MDLNSEGEWGEPKVEPFQLATRKQMKSGIEHLASEAQPTAVFATRTHNDPRSQTTTDLLRPVVALGKHDLCLGNAL